MSSTLSADAKDALTRDIPAAAHCRAALRGALLLYGVADSGEGPRFRTQRASIARLAWSLFEDRRSREIHKLHGSRLRRSPSYEIEVAAAPDSPKPTVRCDRRMELRGAFLACGSLALPARGYHLEFVPPNENAARRLASLLLAEGRKPKISIRKARPLVYFKDIDEIGHVLTSLGAYGALLHLEDVRALKETKNRIHRLVNTEAANVDRSARAAALQRATIATLDERLGLSKLSPALREAAVLRLNHPSETLAELGRRCRPQVNKSTINGRMLALAKLARAL